MPFEFAIAMGVRKGDTRCATARRGAARRQADIDAILAAVLRRAAPAEGGSHEGARCSAAAACVLALAAASARSASFEPPQGNARRRRRRPPNQPGPAYAGQRLAPVSNHAYEENAYAVSQGKRLYRWYNCNGCHAGRRRRHGPGADGRQWRYGATRRIFASIAQGRPNGMPAFGGHIPEDQVWQLVAYVRSMSGQLRGRRRPAAATPCRPTSPRTGARRKRRPTKPRRRRSNDGARR
jgi:cytochrome c oxidase cbb3-type subunit 3